MALAYTFTTKAEILRLVSDSGAYDWLDDLQNDAAYWTEVIEFVTLDIRAYTDRLYTAATLSTNAWIRRIATIMAAYQMSLRRGDPGIYGSLAMEYQARLMEISEGNGVVPGASQSAAVVAVMQNTVIDNRFNIYRNRVRAEQSSDHLGSQQLAYTWPFDWMF